MNKIKMKIKRYDEDSNSVIVAFSSDETATNNPDDYQEFAFQPSVMYPDITDMEALKKRIAEQGIALAQQAKLEEQAANNTTMKNSWKTLTNQTFEYNVDDVLGTTSTVEVLYDNEITVPTEG